MSYTMTVDMPKRESTFVRRSPQLRRELNAIFLAVVTARMQCESDGAKETRAQNEDGAAMARWDKLVAAGHGRLERPYRFNRADAYEEGLG